MGESSHVNILVSSVSKKTPLIQALRNTIPTAKIIGTDKNPNVLGRYFVDQFIPLPGLDNQDADQFIKECNQLDIQAIIPTRNGELLFFAAHRERLAHAGIYCMVSHEQGIHSCLDKWAFYQALAPTFPIIPSSLKLDFNSPTYVVKERKGAGSLGVALNLTQTEALHFAKKLGEPLYQPYIQGQEYSIDVYINRSGEVLGSIARQRQVIVNGESQVTQSVNYPELEALCGALAQKLKLYGHVVFQAIADTQARIHIIECNPRFGGASTLSLAMGLRSFEWFLAEIQGQDLKQLPFQRSPQELKQVRVPADYIFL